MYQFGQFLSSQKNWSDYKQDIDISNLTLGYVTTNVDFFNSNQIRFANYSMKAKGSEIAIFQSLHYYYLKFKVQKKSYGGSHPQVFSLKLQRIENENIIKEQFIKTLMVPDMPIEVNDEYVSFELIIAPNSAYNQLIWQMQRDVLDYTTQEIIDGETFNGRAAIIDVETFSEIVNTIDSFQINSQNTALSKVGIQGPPSLLMCINGEQIRIGKNGIYEISNSIQITFLGFIPKSASDYFIIDYEYGEED